MTKTKHPGIYRRGDKYVGIVTYRDGFGRKKHKWLPPEPTLTRAKDARRKALDEIDRGLRPDGSRMTLSEFVEDVYFPDVVARLRPATVQHYRTLLNKHALPALGRLKLSEISRQHLRKLYAEIPTPSLASQCHLVLSTVFSFAVKDEAVLAVNPCATVRHPRYKAKEARHLEPKEGVRMLEAAVGDPLEPAIILGLAGGVRIGEAVAVRWGDIEDDGTLTVRRSAAGETKSGKIRSLTLPASAWTALKRCKRLQAEQLLSVGVRQDESTHVLANAIGRAIPLDTVTKGFRAFAQAHGFDVTFHGLRHSNAIAMLTAGVDVKTAASRLGHSNPALLLSTYSHFIRSADKAAAERLEGVLNA